MRRVVVANRVAVAACIIRALDALGLESVAVYSDADADAPYLETATTAVRIGADPPTESYLIHDAVVVALHSSGADGLHPGYGFLAENATFARKVIDAEAVWIGPSPEWVELMGADDPGKEIRGTERHSGGGGVACRSPRRAGGFARRGRTDRVSVAGETGRGGIGMLAVSTPSDLMDVVELPRRSPPEVSATARCTSNDCSSGTPHRVPDIGRPAR
jgi:acetyl-CoA carboxylase biotin carboxylase subunit